MTDQNPVFEKTCRDYLAEVGKLDLRAIAPRLGCVARGDGVDIRLFDEVFHVSPSGITGIDGRSPGFDACVILCKYLLMYPKELALGTDWVTYYGLRDSGPLTKFFQNDVERQIAMHFSGRMDGLRLACLAVGGNEYDIGGSYDLAFRFSALPMVPVVLLFNDKDDEFSASARLLFQRRAEQYLDPECLAMLGWRLARRLKKAGSTACMSGP